MSSGHASLFLSLWIPLSLCPVRLPSTSLPLFPSLAEPLDKPTISTSQGMVIEHGEMVTFHCYTVDVDVSIHWVSNNVPLVLNERMQLSADGRRFTILTVQREDAGTYQCEVWGAVEVQSSDITFLQVNYGPDPVEIKVDSGVLSRGVVEVTKGSTVNFWAETQSQPAATYAWYLPNDSILPPTTRTLTIPAVSRKDEGIYRCLVSNRATNQFRLGVLKVLVLASPGSLAKPRVVFQGVDFVEDSSSVTLTCQTAYEGIGILWLREGQPLLPSERLVLSADNRTLVIHSLRQDDAGPYQCKIWTRDQQALSDPFGLTTSLLIRGCGVGVLRTTGVKLDSNQTLQCWAKSRLGAGRLELRGWGVGQLVFRTGTWAHRGACNCAAFNPLTGRPAPPPSW
ncbi:Carcinoembryonic antigen-related cell adhesion molecule 20 [Fukomys damarensis]|uniref:Carcinoembryonic antigen-related cell adhesion molecule 20 n=1 Tax=Fukomys damarensis TaxID=885580 RepID=A0A091EE21_FUKDA|nr:Carcinoembryonic antigen-related cell adhesion molecule 20 [Fukomys damarensis]